MVVDTSAVLAILQDEPERRRFNEAIEAADSRLMSVAPQGRPLRRRRDGFLSVPWAVSLEASALRR